MFGVPCGLGCTGVLPMAWAGSLAWPGGLAVPSAWNECQSQPAVVCSLRVTCSLGWVLDNLLIFLLNVPGWFSHQSVFFSWSTVLLTTNTHSHFPPPAAGQDVGEDEHRPGALEGSPLVGECGGEGVVRAHFLACPIKLPAGRPQCIPGGQLQAPF